MVIILLPLVLIPGLVKWYEVYSKGNMVLSSPNSKKVVSALPSRVTFLGEALGPVVKSLRQAIARQVKSSCHEFVTIDDVSQHMGVISQALTHLQPRLSDLIGSAIEDERASMAEAYRAAGRLEQVLSEFVDGYHEVKASHSGPETSEARTLLLGVYRHHIRRLCEWLEELILVIADPLAASERRGIPMTGIVNLTVVLKFTTPPEMAKLNDLAKSLQIAPGPELEPMLEARTEPALEYRQPASSNPGILGTIGALVFGGSITNAVLGRHRG